MYKTFTLPLKSAFALAALFILTACGGFTIDLDSLVGSGNCLANPFEAECDNDKGIADYRKLIIDDCANNPEKADTVLCTAAEATTNPPSDDENGAEVVVEVVDNTPKTTEVKIEFDKNSLTKTDEEKSENTGLEIVDLCSDPANAGHEQCTPEVIDCINNPFSGNCQGDNLLGNFVRDGVTVSKTVVLQDKRAEDCRTGRIDRALCQNLSVQKQRCTGAAFSTDKICTSVANSVCKADAFDPLCGEKDDVQGAYFSERSYVCYEDPKNPHCTGRNGHVAVVCSEYPFDRLCTGNTDYDDARANACEANPNVSSECPTAPAVEVADVCLDNPFGSTCADSDYNKARKDLAKTCAIQAVTGAVTSACNTIIAAAGPCFIDPFDTACDANPAVRSYIAQLRSSRVVLCKNSTGLFDHLIAPLCTGAPVAKSVCRIDPFNTVCIGDNDYDNSRLSACRDGSSNQQCGNIIAGVCRNNPFDSLCGSGYTNARLSACRDGSASSGQCGNIIAGVCRDDPFDSLCGSGYTNARLSACRDGSANAWQCGNIIAGVCRDNPFDSLCGGGYNNARENACRNGSPNTQCGNIITGVCSGNPFDPLCGSGYTQNRRNACSGNPFATRCAGDVYNDLRVSFCTRNAGNHPSCPAPEPATPQVTAKVWADSFDEPLSHGATAEDTESQFLIGRATDLDTGGARILSIRGITQQGNLNLADATFNFPRDYLGSLALGGDAADGVAFFAAEGNNDEVYNYAGILEGTNLGAPLTETQGSAKWAGSFQEFGSYPTDFVLNISFGTGDGAGEIEAFIQKFGYWYDYHLTGEFDDAGVITGTARGGIYRIHDPDNRGTTLATGELTGLIGEEGAVGAFLVGDYFGGFVARPSSADELWQLEDKCADNPFHKLCNVGYEAERKARVEYCIIGGNANDTTRCGRSEQSFFRNEMYYCFKHPFLSNCSHILIGYYEQTLANRVAFCRTEGNASNELCTHHGTYDHICTTYPFDAQCLGDNDYNQDRQDACTTAGTGSTECLTLAGLTCGSNPFSSYCGGGYNNVRETACRNGGANPQCGGIIAGVCGNNPFDPLCGSGYTQNRRSLCTDNPFAPRCAGEGYNDLRVSFCDKVANAGNPACPQPTKVTAKVWADSFDEDLSHGATAEDTKSQFLIGRETDLDTGGLRTYTTDSDFDYNGGLNLADATFEGVALGGDAEDGVGFFAAQILYRRNNYNYAGILSGTNLGAPLTQTQGTAKWIGSFRTQNRFATDFILNVSFGTGSGAGEVTALVYKYGGYDDHRIAGEFDDAGVITGTIVRGIYRPNEPEITKSRGTLTGLIGEEGAVGAFLLNQRFGGFVARPPSEGELRPLVQICADDPFNGLCNIGFEPERDARIKHCIIGGNANDDICDSANGSTYCMDDPFYYACDTIWPDYYEQTRANRLAFCRTAGNAGNRLCTIAKTYGHICRNYPFDAQCLGDDRYDRTRERACTTAGTGSTECQALAGINCGTNPFHSYCDSGYNNARESACASNPGQSRCRNTVERVCNGNPFDTLCRNTTIYLNARKTQCRQAWNDPRCPATIRAVCGVDPFDRMCNSVYDTPRETACRNGTATTGQCRDTVAGICSGNPFDTLCGSGYTQNRRSLCTDNPFAPRCAGDVYNDLRVSFCERNAGTHSKCPAPQVTAGVWADSFDEELETTITRDSTSSKFLKARATDLDNGGVRSFGTLQNGLNLADATFNGVALGGDAADGAAFFAANYASDWGLYSYAGILSGTNLGAPLTDTIGSAKWVGSFLREGNYATDFVLNVSFGTGDGAGEIEALVQEYSVYNNHNDYHIAGEFDDAGLITGTANRGTFRTNDPDNRGEIHTTGTLTGLIGEEGAVGAFLIGNHFGGFVARPSSVGELRTLTETCADDPFHGHCNLGYESQRNARIEHCIIGGNANDASCDSASERYSCIDNPFRTDCDDLHPLHYEQARANRLAFCRTAGNAGNALCIVEATFSHICTNHPFDAQCLGDDRYDRTRERACTTAGTGSTECQALAGINCGTNPFHSYCDSGYNNARESACASNPGQSRCRNTVERVCNGNPFDTLCRNTTIYLNARKTQCRQAWNDPRCPATIRAVCGVDPFDRMCNSVYDTPRETACRNGTATTGQCRDTVAGICSGNPFDTLCGSGYTQNRRSLCTDNPFAPRCAGDVYNDLRVSFCERNAGTHSKCPAPQVTAGVWADSFDEELETTITRDSTSSKFLKARATDLDNGGVRSFGTLQNGLNLADATFNGVALGGDAADGAAFFAANYASDWGLYSYAGILSGTNLGAPLTDTIGSAKWVGSFLREGNYATDFVLNVSFGTGDGAGEIEALVQEYSVYNNHNDYHIAGEFDDAGLITGTANRGTFRTNDPDNRGEIHTTGTLTGLIGEEGAVGAFLIGNHFGGFVARPSSVGELRTLTETCADDPFNGFCNLGYESERIARLDHCIIGGNANDESCGSANELYSCINNPFSSDCDERFSQHYEQARVNRVAFCRTEGNAGNVLCTVTDTFAHICTNHPFDAQCRGDNVYRPIRRNACSGNPFAPRCAGDVYNNLRVSFCDKVANAGNPACPTIPLVPHVTAKVWADSFDTPLNNKASRSHTESQFLIGRATDLNDNGAVIAVLAETTRGHSSLNFADATFNGVALGGDAADGVAFFLGARYGRYYNSYPTYNRYAGILSGTNLGAPLTNTSGSAKWVGSFKYDGSAPADFVLNVSFGTGDGAGEIEALVEKYTPQFDIYVKGEFNDAGVITGTAHHGYFRKNDPADRSNSHHSVPGKLTGLIGEEGAVGAFIVRNSYGGFVARPSSADELRTLEQTCNDDPFNKLCAIGYESQRHAIIEHCIIGGNANDEERCGSAKELNTCITDPFRSNYIPFVGTCSRKFLRYHEQTRANRVEFCRTAGNAGNALCTVDTTFNHICSHHPFDAQCLGNDTYTRFRRYACTNDPFATECAGDAYNDLRVSFCEGKVGTHASCPAPTPQVTAKVWADSFDEDLDTTVSANDTESKFLIGRATDLDNGGVRPYSPDPDYNGDLNLADATFNGVALGGYGTNGVAYFTSGEGGKYSYAGILSSTNLGAPLTDTAGSAKWVGSFLYLGLFAGDFVLNLSFGTGEGAGELEAILQTRLHFDIHIAGEFDDTGVITGTARSGFFPPNDPDNRGSYIRTEGELTGLIGEKGAVGAFLLDKNFGVFVARSSSAAERRTLRQTCADDPFHGHCTIGYESERNAILEHCIIGGNANDESCDSVKSYICISEPFYNWCDSIVPDHYERARANRLAFCRTAGNADNRLCTVETTFAHICTNHPFDAQCRGDNSYRSIRRDACSGDPFAERCTGDAYNDLRVSFCENNAGNSACPQPSPNRVTAADWVASFDTAPATVASTSDSQFLQGTQTGLNTGTLFSTTPTVYSKNLSNIYYDYNRLDSDTPGGFAYFIGELPSGDKYSYAGILSDTDLGAPLSQTTGKATWRGQYQYLYSGDYEYPAKADMTLKITFGAEGAENAGKISASLAGLVEAYITIDGVFNNQGVISGTATRVYHSYLYTRSPYSGLRIHSFDPIGGTLTGLIGEKGAVGAFYSERNVDTRVGYFSGGFVAVPDSVGLASAVLTTPDSVTTSDWVASFETVPVSVTNEYTQQFLQGSETELNTGGLTDVWDRKPKVYTEKFADTTFDGVAFDGDATGGFSYFYASGPDGWNYQYAGILANTDLGAPFTQTTGSVSWNGVFAFESHGDRRKRVNDFVLKITFGDDTHAGTLDARIQRDQYGEHSILEAHFDTNGVIRGTVTEWFKRTVGDSPLVKSSRVPTVTGLIGQKGAVGSFFAGGFIASPDMTLSSDVTYKDWHKSFNDKDMTMIGTKDDVGLATFLRGYGYADSSQWLRVRHWSLGFYSVPNVIPGTLAVFYFTSNFNGRVRHYAGIAKTATLGAPLEVLPADINGNPATAIWNGELGIIANNSAPSKRDIDLSVDFTNRTINHSSVLNTGRESISLGGTWNDNGLINGTITYDPNPVLNAVNARDGVVTGLIGEYGAVGAFISNDDVTDTPFAGGFVVAPPSE